MKLIDTFLFSEPYEKEILLAKFILEEAYVSEWIIIENSYTFQGNYKGLFAQEVLDSDARFDRFKSRIKVISGETVYPKIEQKEGVQDHIAFNAEFYQRELSRDYIFNRYSDEDFIFISDTDEMIDLSNPVKREFFIGKMKSTTTDLVCMPKTVYAFDFDNQWKVKDRSTAIFKLSYFKKNQYSFSEARRKYLTHAIQWPHQIHFEYTSCFSIEHIYIKCSSFSHAGTSLEEIQRAMLCNHMPIAKSRGDVLTLDLKNWYQKVSLNDRNSPLYIREHLALLKTNNISSEYLKNRKQYYPTLFSIQNLSIYYKNRLTKKIANLIVKLKQVV